MTRKDFKTLGRKVLQLSRGVGASQPPESPSLSSVGFTETSWTDPLKRMFRVTGWDCKLEVELTRSFMGPLEGGKKNPLQVGRVWVLEGRAEEASEELGLSREEKARNLVH